MTTQEQLATHYKESDFELRTPEMYDDHCSLVEGDSRGTHSREYGINRCSILNQLRYFSVVSGALVPDVMHDLLEGVLQYEVKLLLTQFISEDHYFTLGQLNHRIESLELGYSEARDRPTQITSTTLSSNDNLWTMRFESKHSYFKKLSSHLGNFTNICHTLAMRLEQLQCYLRQSLIQVWKLEQVGFLISIRDIILY